MVIGRGGRCGVTRGVVARGMVVGAVWRGVMGNVECGARCRIWWRDGVCDTFDRDSLLLLIRLGPFCYTLLKHYLPSPKLNPYTL